MTKARNYNIAVYIWPATAGTLTRRLDSLDGEVQGIELDPVALTGNQLHFTVPSLAGTYEARLNRSNGAIEGVWKQNGQSLPLVVSRPLVH